MARIAGSGKALAELMDGRQPEMNFGFYGNTPKRNPGRAPATVAG